MTLLKPLLVGSFEFTEYAAVCHHHHHTQRRPGASLGSQNMLRIKTKDLSVRRACAEGNYFIAKINGAKHVLKTYFLNFLKTLISEVRLHRQSVKTDRGF